MKYKPSLTEKALFYELHQLGLKPEPQYKIDKCHVDLAFPNKQLVVEVDGPHHNTTEHRENDKKRDNFLKSQGWTILRFKADRVYNSPAEVANIIKMTYEGYSLEQTREYVDEPSFGNLQAIGVVFLVLFSIFGLFLLFGGGVSGASVNNGNTNDLIVELEPQVENAFFEFQKEERSDEQIIEEVNSRMNDRNVHKIASSWGLSAEKVNSAPCVFAIYIPGFQDKYQVEVSINADCLGTMNRKGHSVNVYR